MLPDNVRLNLACATADGGREVIEVSTLPESSLNGITVTNVKAPSSALQADSILSHAAKVLSCSQFAAEGQGEGIVLAQGWNFGSSGRQSQ